MASKTQRPDADRIAAFRAELDAFIDARVAEIKKTCEGVPAESIRIDLMRGYSCQCAAVQRILREDEKAAAA